MQTLGITDATPRSDGWLKSLFWPSIKNDGDVEYLTEQGLWICVVLAILTEGTSALGGHLFLGMFDAAFFFLAGIGMRMRSRMAAILVFVVYLLSGIDVQVSGGQGFGILKSVFLALMLANIRGMWLSASWPKDGSAPFRLDLTWRDKLSDQWPQEIWPRLEWIFYVLALLEVLALLTQLFMVSRRTA